MIFIFSSIHIYIQVIDTKIIVIFINKMIYKNKWLYKIK